MIRRDILLCILSISAYLIASTVALEAIIGGTRAEIHDFPYQVTLQRGTWSFCGGGIIDEHHILTAAHCVVSEDGEITNEPMTILAGTNDLYNTHPPAVKAQVKKVFILKEFEFNNTASHADIAVLKLLHSLDFKKHPHLKHLEVSEKENEHHIGKTAKIAGFGWDWMRTFQTRLGIRRIGGSSDTHLRYAEANVLNDTDCQAGYRRITLDFKKEFCARVHQNGDVHGVCNGDSGSPLVLDGKTVIGILTVGAPSCSEKVRAGLYTSAAHYRNFIEYAKHDVPRDDIYSRDLPL